MWEQLAKLILTAKRGSLWASVIGFCCHRHWRFSKMSPLTVVGCADMSATANASSVFRHLYSSALLLLLALLRWAALYYLCDCLIYTNSVCLVFSNGPHTYVTSRSRLLVFPQRDLSKASDAKIQHGILNSTTTNLWPLRSDWLKLRSRSTSVTTFHSDLLVHVNEGINILCVKCLRAKAWGSFLMFACHWEQSNQHYFGCIILQLF